MLARPAIRTTKRKQRTIVWLTPSDSRRRLALILLAVSSAPLSAQEGAQTVASEASAPAEAPGYFFWTDSSLSLLPYGDGYVVDPEEQSTLTFEHAHASKLGDLFMFVDFTKFHGDAADGTTWYGEFGPRLSFGKLLGKDLSYSLFKRSLFEIKDVLIATQYERGEDADVAEAVLLGVGFDLDVREAGILGALGKFNFVQVNFYGRAELTEGAEDGISDMQITLATAYPFEISDSQFLVDGYFDWVVGLGDEDWNFHINPQLTMDLGALWNKPGKLYAGLEFDLWWNKYQIPNSSAFDTNQAAVSLLVKYHL